MKVKSTLAKPFANYVYNKIKKETATAVKDQESIFQELIKSAANTTFGKEHGFKEIKTYEDFKKAVPVRDYEALKPYIERIKKRRTKCIVERQTTLSCQNKRYYKRRKIYSHLQRFY
ncbi:MAG: GH3 auxin-responsive promoter family protein [Arachidicoccus sp.]|nr:GH3 auxin-responsive promoter family protein [Arachidicoccus sp.]